MQVLRSQRKSLKKKQILILKDERMITNLLTTTM